VGIAGYSVMNQCSSTAIVGKGVFECRVLSGMVGPEREKGNGGWIVMQNGCYSNNSTNIEMI